MYDPRILALRIKFDVQTLGSSSNIPDGHAVLDCDESTGMVVTLPKQNLEGYRTELKALGPTDHRTMVMG